MTNDVRTNRNGEEVTIGAEFDTPRERVRFLERQKRQSVMNAGASFWSDFHKAIEESETIQNLLSRG